MRTKEKLKQQICKVIDRHRAEILKMGDNIMASPELGFKEFKTAKFVSNMMEKFELPHQTELAITGVKGELKGKKPGPSMALIGELDALIVQNHPAFDSKIKAVHACGHNAQIAGLLGAMIGLIEANAVEELAGRIVFFAVPGEEYVEIEYRNRLVQEGKIQFLGGKPELIRLGYFDDINIAMMIHTHSNPDFKKAAVAESSNGFIAKKIRFIGRSAHAGIAPGEGINALNAAHVSLAAIHAQRETFRDSDTIRVHPIITKGGESVNAVPAEVWMETYVRGKTTEAILDANSKIDRALRAGALAIGANVEIMTFPGYLPLKNNPELKVVFQKNCTMLFGKEEFTDFEHRTSSTDMGDISQIMPALHPYMAGAEGTSHSAEWHISDKELAYIAPAKALALTAVDILWGHAEKAAQIIAAYQPQMTKKEYLAFQKTLCRTELFNGEIGLATINGLPGKG